MKRSSPSEPDSADSAIAALLALMVRLRDPESGCPWDVAQSFATIAPYTIEEAYEVADAIARGASDDLKDELGDLLLQVVFHARMAEEAGLFSFADVARHVTDKMQARHPHVFGTASAADADSVVGVWERQKAFERADRARREGRAESVLDGVALALPALMRAQKLQRRAARVGFDWGAVEPILAKIEEEIAELRAEIAAGDHPATADELGDTIFALVNLARHLDVDAETALRGTNDKFTRRFRAVEAELAAEGIEPAEAGLERMEALWQAAKLAERGG